MLKTVSNIIKGIGKRLTGKRKSGLNAKPLSFVQRKILKHQEDQTVKTIRVGGHLFGYRRPYEFLHTYKELFEDEIYAFHSGSASPYIIDCGANIGLSVVYFKSIFPNAQIVAFEPDAGNFELLTENIRHNHLSGVVPRQAAVWTRNETLQFASTGSQGSHISQEDDKQAAPTVPVEGVRLADLLRERPVDCLKIDIEGVENLILADCGPHLHQVKHLFVEYHGKTADTAKLQQLIEIIRAAGFHLYIKLAADPIRHPLLQYTTDGPFDVQLNLFCHRH